MNPTSLPVFPQGMRNSGSLPPQWTDGGREGTGDNSRRDTTPQTVNLGKVDSIPPGQGRSFLVGDKAIAVFRQRDGKLFATQNACPHKQGPLAEGVIGAGTVLCPLHAHKFNLETGAGSEHDECLKTYPVLEAGGDILLQI